MNLNLSVIGKLKKGPERDLFDIYRDRISKVGGSLHIGPLILNEMNESQASKPAQRMDEEAEMLLAKVTEGEPVIALDERGKSLTSTAFSDYLLKQRDDGARTLNFVIGGPDGHGSRMKNEATMKLSLSQMTLTHGFARILLVEQIYRALTILLDHPYHRQ